MLDNSDISSDYLSESSISYNDLVMTETYKKYQKYKLKYLKLLEIYGGKKGSSGSRGNKKSKKQKKRQKKKKDDDDDDDDDDYSYDEDNEDEYRNKYTEVTPIYTKNIIDPINKKEILILPGIIITSLCIISSIISNLR